MFSQPSYTAATRFRRLFGVVYDLCPRFLNLIAGKVFRRVNFSHLLWYVAKVTYTIIDGRDVDATLTRRSSPKSGRCPTTASPFLRMVASVCRPSSPSRQSERDRRRWRGFGDHRSDVEQDRQRRCGISLLSSSTATTALQALTPGIPALNRQTPASPSFYSCNP